MRLVRTPTARPLGAFPGTQRPITVAQPAAGTEWSLTLPGSAWWRLLGGICTLTTSATASTRVATLRYSYGGVNLIEWGANTGAPAASALQVNYVGEGGNSSGIGGLFTTVAVTNLIMPAGSVLGSHTYSIQAGDQYSSVALLFEEIRSGPHGEPYGLVETDTLTDSERYALQGH